ncbi:MAG: type VI secretion system ATPase TssH [Isosphaeraceae bacterium]
MGIDTSTLISKLNPTCLRALEAAANLCRARNNAAVDLEHWFFELNQVQDSDLRRIFRRFGVDRDRVGRELHAAIDQLKTGHNRAPTISPLIDTLIREAWVIASVKYRDPLIRSGTLLLALLNDERLARVAREMSRIVATISAETRFEELPELVAESPEEAEVAPVAAAAAKAAAGAAAGGASGESEAGAEGSALQRFTIDLTALARQGKIDPIRGRDFEVRQMADILIRRRQNNPLLVGEAGVGKTAVVEGFALRVAQGDVPAPLKDVEVRALDLGLLQAGAGVKGEFENRLKGVINEVAASPRPVILFIDEAHTLIGAGGQSGQGDAANLLKPALARGELRTIAATTWAEFKKYFEKDAALERRFQVVKVEEPNEERAVVMMRAMAPMLENHHGVRILDEAIDASVRLSARFITGRQLPDKSLSLLDTACARVALGQDAVPAGVEAVRRRIEEARAEVERLEREGLTGPSHDARLQHLRDQLERDQAEQAEVERQWAEEKTLVSEVASIRAQLEAGEGDPAALRPVLDEKTARLRALQGENPLMHVHVDAQVVAGVVSAWTGIPVGKMRSEEISDVLALSNRLRERILGQDAAIEAVCERIQTARANLTDPRRPVGVFLLVGPSGVGKTETALALADALYGSERSVISINMSEYKEAHTVSGLKGSPPGYVGYGEGGVLTEAVRKKPFSVVLLDEIEKAHPDVTELFYQVFDKGTLEDGEGRVVDFKSTIILLTSNLATDLIMRLMADPDTAPGHDALAQALHPELLKVFKPAFLGRLVVVPYLPISDGVMSGIARLQLGRIGQRIREHHKAEFAYDDSLIRLLVSRCTEVGSGARNLDQLLMRRLLPELSRRFLSCMASGQAITSVRVSASDDSELVIDVS